MINHNKKLTENKQFKKEYEKDKDKIYANQIKKINKDIANLELQEMEEELERNKQLQK